jgi:CheY-like chemotaxis protein
MSLVDDNEVNLKLLHTFFVRRGFTDIRLARDGSEAVKLYEDALHEQNPFYLVFMDIGMPVCFRTLSCPMLSDANLETR